MDSNVDAISKRSNQISSVLLKIVTMYKIYLQRPGYGLEKVLILNLKLSHLFRNRRRGTKIEYAYNKSTIA